MDVLISGTGSASDPDDFLHEIEEDPTSHAADYHFSEIELRWIKKNFGNTTKYLLSYDLNFYGGEGYRGGKTIVRAITED